MKQRELNTGRNQT